MRPYLHLDWSSLSYHSLSRVLAGMSFVSVKAVDIPIHKLRALVAAFEDEDLTHWLPEQTLQVFVAPMLRALGWEPPDSDECGPHCSNTRLAGLLISKVIDPVIYTVIDPPWGMVI